MYVNSDEGQFQHVAVCRLIEMISLHRGPEQWASVLEAFQQLVRHRGTVCRRNWKRRDWQLDSSLAGWTRRFSYVLITRERSRHNSSIVRTLAHVKWNWNTCNTEKKTKNKFVLFQPTTDDTVLFQFCFSASQNAETIIVGVAWNNSETNLKRFRVVSVFYFSFISDVRAVVDCVKYKYCCWTEH